jgi:hypothetical protein
MCLGGAIRPLWIAFGGKMQFKNFQTGAGMAVVCGGALLAAGAFVTPAMATRCSRPIRSEEDVLPVLTS